MATDPDDIVELDVPDPQSMSEDTKAIFRVQRREVPGLIGSFPVRRRETENASVDAYKFRPPVAGQVGQRGRFVADIL